MKKFLKVTGIVLAVPLTVALGTFLFVPGLPGKLYIQHKFASSQSSVKEYTHSDVSTPDDFKEITREGMTVRVPQSVEQHGKEGDSEIKKRLYTNDDVTVFFMEHTANDTFDMYDNSETDPEKFQKIMECFKGGCSDTNYDFFRFIRNFTPDDIKITKHGASAAAVSYAVLKETLISSELECCDISTDNAKGFVIHIGSNESGDTYVVELYSNDNLNDSRSVMIRAKSGDDVMWQIINSADIAE